MLQRYRMRWACCVSGVWSWQVLLVPQLPTLTLWPRSWRAGQTHRMWHARCVCCSRDLAGALQELGHTLQATALSTFGRAFDAWDMRGLTTDARTLAVHDRTVLLWRLMGDTLFTQRRVPSHMAGLSTRLMLSWLANADARLWLLQQLSPAERGQLCERSLGTDGCEGDFSLYHMRNGGRKPRMRIAVDSLDTVEFFSSVRDMPMEERGGVWHMHDAQSSRLAYQCHTVEPAAGSSTGQPSSGDGSETSTSGAGGLATGNGDGNDGRGGTGWGSTQGTWNGGSALDPLSQAALARDKKLSREADHRAKAKIAALRDRAQYKGADKF